MKILLIGIPRSGTTTLMDSIGSSLKLYIKNEPFNEESNKASTGVAGIGTAFAYVISDGYQC